jgi:hypothetical protein
MTDPVFDVEKHVPNFVKQFIISVRRQAVKDEYFQGTTDKSRVKLIILLNEQLQDKNNRIAVLQAITGIPLQSQNNLTQFYTSILINEVIDATATNPTTIAHIERMVKERTGFKSWELFPWDAPKVNLPDLQSADNTGSGYARSSDSEIGSNEITTGNSGDDQLPF